MLSKKNAAQKRWRDKNKNYTATKLRQWRLSKLGLSETDYNNMLVTQANTCAICKLRCKSGRMLSVDHCHATGTVRGLLCRSCNLMLGNAHDSVLMLKAAIFYLEGDDK